MAVSTMAFCSGSVALHYSLPQIQTPSIIFLLDTANPRNLLAALDFRPELYLLESEKKNFPQQKGDPICS